MFKCNFLVFPLFLSFFAHAAPKSKDVSVEKLRLVNVSWNFKYHKNFPGRIQLYELNPDMYEYTGETKNYPIGQKLPVVKKIPNSFKMKAPGGFVPLALTITNPTNKDWFFYANFHRYKPNNSATGIRIHCLCIQHIFKVKAKTVWFRIGKVDLNRRFTANEIEITHDIIGMTVEELKARNYFGDGFTVREYQ